MEKKTVFLASDNEIAFMFQKQEILTKRRLSIEDMRVVLATCLASYFKNGMISGSSTDPLGCEYAKILAVVDLCTNIEIDGKNIQDIILSGLWYEIYTKIENYPLMEDILSNAINDKKKEFFGLQKAIQPVIDALSNLPSLDKNTLEKFTQSVEEIKKKEEGTKDIENVKIKKKK